MGSGIRENLQTQLRDYISHTLTYAGTVREFCDGLSKWTLQRETELDAMRSITDRAEQITLTFQHVQESEDKSKALGEYLLSNLTRVTADSRRQKLEKELGEVLKSTLEGLEKLQRFLDAVENLAVTSLFVFMAESFMPKGVSSIPVRSLISAARLVSPFLVRLKRNPEAFFRPSLGNVPVLALELDQYIRNTQQICEMMEKKSRSVSCSGGVHEWSKSPTVHLVISEENLQNMYDHLLQLITIRMDESFKTAFLFGEKFQNFILVFGERHSRMADFLSGLDEAADQLDKMKLGSNISSVVGSSVGITGGVLSIVGLALAPVTAGVSLALTATGVGLGITSGVNSLVTGITEIAVNQHHGQNANTIFSQFMEDVQKVLESLGDEISLETPLKDPDDVSAAAKLAGRFGAVAKGIDAAVDMASAVKAFSRGGMNVGFQEAKAGPNIPRLAADLPDIGQVAKGTPLALSKVARAGLIGVNALFIGLDVLFICKDSVSLVKGSKNDVARLIRDRSALWRSEVESWKKIHEHLSAGISGFYRKWEILEQPFYP